MNILVVDDEKLTRTALQHNIEKLGHHVFLAETGEEAIKMGTDNQIDFIITDIMMPGIGGLSLVSILRNVYLAKIPIVHISGLDNEIVCQYVSICQYLCQSVRNRSLSLGADDFIGKPFSMAEIAEVINKHAQTIS